MRLPLDFLNFPGALMLPTQLEVACSSTHVPSYVLLSKKCEICGSFIDKYMGPEYLHLRHILGAFRVIQPFSG